MLREEMCQFVESKGKDTSELSDEKFLCELLYLCDITSLQLQGRGCVITDMYAAVRAFKTKLCLWETQMLQANLGSFSLLQNHKNTDRRVPKRTVC